MITIIILICCPIIGFWLKLTKPFKYLAHYTNNKLTKGKPFNCTFCLSFWLAAATYYPFQPSWILYLLVCFASAAIGFFNEINQTNAQSYRRPS